MEGRSAASRKDVMTRSHSGRRRRLAATCLAVASLVGALTITGASPASAACATTYRSTNGNDPNRTFQISSASTCNDLNIRQATAGQYYRGEYRSGTTWYNGAAGWKYRSPSTTNLAVVISGIANTTTVRMTGSSVNAHAYAVH